MNIELGKTYETRSGHTVRIVCVDRKGQAMPVIGLILHEDGTETYTSFSVAGEYVGNVSSPYDLIREHIPVTYRWANVYVPGDTPFIGSEWDCESTALGQTRQGRKGTIKLAFDPSGNLIVDKCEIISTSKAGV